MSNKYLKIQETGLKTKLLATDMTKISLRNGSKTLRQLGRILSKSKPKRQQNMPRMIFAKLVNISKRF